MKRIMKTLALVLAVCMMFGCAGALAEGAADVVFVGGAIYTVDERDTMAEALAVTDGKISYVGDGAGAKALIGEGTEVIELGGKLMLPGFMDGHIHTVSLDFFDFNLAGIQTLDETMAVIKDYVDAHPEQQSFFGFGYMTAFFTGDEAAFGPRKERLDEIVSDRPIQIIAFDGHTMWANSRAFADCGVTKDTPAPRGGIIEKDPQTGELWGTLKDAASALMGDPVVDPEKLRGALKSFQSTLNGLGYTGIMTIPAYGTFKVPFDGYMALESAGELTLRITGAMPMMSWRVDQDLAALTEAMSKYQSDMVKVTGAKFFMDGVLDGRSAYMLEPYADNPDNVGVPAWLPADVNDAAARVNAAGAQCHIHAMGDAGVRMALDALQYAKDHAPGDHRNAMTHLQVVDPKDLPRFKALDVIAIVNPYWMLKVPEYWEIIEHTALGERAEHMYPLRSLLDEGVKVVTASDFPVTAVPNPFEAIRLGITRKFAAYGDDGAPLALPYADADLTLWPEERASVRDMIRSLTGSAAYLMGSEDRVGTLEVGKEADLIVLDRNILEIDPVDIQNTRVLKTYVGGRLVHER